jgi:hypothetical protein
VSGSADNHQTRINDLVIDLVPNKYSALADFSDSESESDDEEDEKPQTLKSAQKALNKVVAKIELVEERKTCAEKELSLAQEYASTVSSAAEAKTLPDPKMMKDVLDLYNSQRKAHYDTITACAEEMTDLKEEREKKQKELEREEKAFMRSNRKKVEAKKKKQAEKEEKKREKKEKKPEKLPNVYRVRITIEIPSSEVEGNDAEQEATLILTYTTSSASWTPHVRSHPYFMP